MFIEFQVGNFRSFRDIQKFTMQAAPLRTNDSGDEEGNVFTSSDIRLLKSKAIYGSNASGKSNFVKAFSAFALMVMNCVSVETIPKQIWKDSFKLLTDWNNEPIFFQYIFLNEGLIYRYGFQILNGKVSYEWLFEGEKRSEKEYLMRNGNEYKINKENFIGADKFVELASSPGNELFRDDTLFLTAAALNGNKIASKLRNEIKSIMMIDGIADNDARQFGMHTLVKGTEKQKNALKDFMKAGDTGIENLELKEINVNDFERGFNNESNESDNGKALSLFSSHIRYDENGKMIDKIFAPFGEWESEGTSKLFGIGALILESLKKGRTLVIDEFDARFHPNLSLKIIELYNSKKTNPHNAQIIFVTHDSGLLHRAELRRDQICFVNKDKYGISILVSLIEFKGVRKDASYEKEYLNGNYEGVPYLGKMDSVVMQNNVDYGL
jgi:uncharacterized protein